MPGALIIGNSDGIGLALTRRLIELGWTAIGISRSPSPLTVTAERYRHRVADVRADGYAAVVRQACTELERVDACIYCAGIGESLDVERLDVDVDVFQVNLMGMVTTIEAVLPRMLAAGAGHIIGLSSQADTFVNPDSPSYSASKAGMSAYLEGLALAVRSRGVYVTNVRLGFVDTKMAKADIKPFQISAAEAAEQIVRCLARRPIRHTYPRRMAALLWLLGWPLRVRRYLA